MDAKEFLKTLNLPKNWSGEDEEYGQWLFYEKNIIEAMEQYHQSKVNNVVLDGVSVSLPSVDDVGIIAVEIAEINNEMTAQEQAFFIAGFSECIKYLEMQSNER